MMGCSGCRSAAFTNGPRVCWGLYVLPQAKADSSAEKDLGLQVVKPGASALLRPSTRHGCQSCMEVGQGGDGILQGLQGSLPALGLAGQQ